MEGFSYAEREAARVLGVPQVCFRAVRKTKNVHEGVDWAVDGGRIVYSRSGLLKTVSYMVDLQGAEAIRNIDMGEGAAWLMACLLPDDPSFLTHEKNGMDQGCSVAADSSLILRTDAHEKATVTRFYMNKKILGASLEKSGADVRVRVKSNVNFVRGMTITVRPVDVGLYELVGRCPRYRRRW